LGRGGRGREEGRERRGNRLRNTFAWPCLLYSLHRKNPDRMWLKMVNTAMTKALKTAGFAGMGIPFVSQSKRRRWNKLNSWKKNKNKQKEREGGRESARAREVRRRGGGRGEGEMYT